MRGSKYIEEDSHLKVYDMKLIKRLLSEVLPFMRYVILALVFLLITSLLALVGPYLIKIAIDVYIKNKDYSGLNKIVMIFFIILMLQSLTEYIRIYLTQYVGQRVMYSLRIKVFSHIQNLTISYFDKNPVGRIMTRVTNDIEVLNEMFNAGVVTIFSDFVMLVGIVIVLFFMNFKLALITFSVIPILIYITYAFRKLLRASYRDTRAKTAKVNSYLQESISGVKIIQLFTREKARHKGFKRINGEFRDAYFKTITAYSMFFPTIEILGAISIALIIFFGGQSVLASAITMGTLVAFIEYLRKFFLPIRDMTEKFNILQSAMSSAERIYKLLDTESEENVKKCDMSTKRLAGEIEFKNVWFAYNDDEYVLKDISFKIAPGEKIAFVGATGAGKTSIVNLISTFYNIQKGDILIDGVDIYSYDKYYIRKNIGIVLQDEFTFSGTIKDNITLNDDTVDIERVVKASKSAYANEFIEKLPGGYDEILGEGGARLSAGQRQLLSFARVLIYDPRILILDEATSTVDAHTEYIIQKATEKLMSDRTSIIIAHRLSTIKNVDRIFVFHKGQIVEMGTHDELYAKKGVYHKLYELQYKN
ncbi:ABC transporter ATP-binding protein, partial [Thermodesulfobacteriota bacterium]